MTSTAQESPSSWEAGVDMVVNIREKGEKFTAYRVWLRPPKQGISYRIRRYSALRELHNQLASTYPDSLKASGVTFPPKSLFGGSSMVESRKKQLNKYFQGIIQRESLTESVVFRVSMELTDGMKFYDTLGVCPVCMVVDKEGMNWIPACLQENRDKVYHIVKCSKHGNFRTLRCASAGFFKRMVSRSLRGGLSTKSQPYLGCHAEVDIARKKATTIGKQCVVWDFPLYDRSGFVPDDTIREACVAAVDHRAILRVQGKLADDIQELNRKILLAATSTSSVIIAELSHDRIIELSELPNSAILNRHVIPAIRYFVQPGEEMRCHQDLVHTIGKLSEVLDIQVYITLLVERPFPDLTIVLKMLRRHAELVRFIMIALARPPSDIIKIANAHSSTKSTKPEASEPNVDIFELLKVLETNTGGDIKPDDFVSPMAGCLMEPFLEKTGAGPFNFRPSSTLGAVTLLLNSDDFDSLPASRVVNLDVFVDKMLPLVLSGSSPSSVALASQTKHALKQALRPEWSKSQIPSLITMMMDSSIFESAAKLLARSQLLMVYSELDVGALDIEQVLAPGELSTLVRKCLGTL
eukprot:m.88394 g.88394  ORF g.88394 m.88394 type:complete len:581 (-) comp13162_c0_seq3:2347-4089(-)